MPRVTLGMLVGLGRIAVVLGAALLIRAAAADLGPGERWISSNSESVQPGRPLGSNAISPPSDITIRAAGRVNQDGLGNSARLMQQGEGLMAEIVQRGQDNRAEILQQGAAQTASVIQIGNGNQASIHQSLGAQTLNVIQQGNGGVLNVSR